MKYLQSSPGLLSSNTESQCIFKVIILKILLFLEFGDTSGDKQSLLWWFALSLSTQAQNSGEESGVTLSLESS